MTSKLKSEIRHEQNTFYNVHISRLLKESPARFWRYISPKTSHTNTFMINDRLTSDETELSDSFNEHFKFVFTRDNARTPHFSGFENLPAMDDLEINEAGVFNLFLKLDERKSPVSDEIPNVFLKRYAEWSSKFLSHIQCISVIRYITGQLETVQNKAFV